MNLEVIDLHHARYQDAYRFQLDCVEEKVSHPDRCPDRLLFVEHDAVYTLGRYATDQNLIFSAEEREGQGIDLVSTDRGGEVTYHGPGQITGYPILLLSIKRGRGVAWYVNGLEEMLILTLQDFGISGRRDSINPGVWVQTDKIAAIGVRVTRQVTMHGFALNVRTNMDHYAGIIPCGVKGRGVTSMHQHCHNVVMEDVRKALVQRFSEVFGYSAVCQKRT